MLCLGTMGAQAQKYAPGVLYHLVSAVKGQAVGFDKQGNISLEKLNADAPNQHFTVTDLSGSWRFINPFVNKALRTEGNALEMGENNGSDEAQLWKVVADGKFLNLIPTNRPNMAAAVHGNKLVLIKKTRLQATKLHNLALSKLLTQALMPT